MDAQIKIIKFIVVLLLLFHNKTSSAQVMSPEELVIKSIQLNEKKYLTADYTGKSFVFSIAFGTNKSGFVDTVLYHQPSVGLNELINFQLIKGNIIKGSKKLINYKNRFFVVFIYISRQGDEPITNEDILISNWTSLTKGFSEAQGNRNLTLLSPVLMTYGGKTLVN